MKRSWNRGLSAWTLSLFSSTLVVLLSVCNSITDPTPIPDQPDLTAGGPGELAALDGIAAKKPKVDVCHKQGKGKTKIINISENAVPAHLGHGDNLVGDEICDDIDNDCDGDVDEGCEALARCPCDAFNNLGSISWATACLGGGEPDHVSCTDTMNEGTIAQICFGATAYRVSAVTLFGTCQESPNGPISISTEEVQTCIDLVATFIAAGGVACN